MQRRALTSCLATLCLLGANTFGQDDDEDIFEFSPFTVTAEDNSGYRATSTLAGTRIKTDLKDLGAAISVVTAEFMEDTGATGLEDLFQYTTGTEIGGINGNYSAAGLNAGGGVVDQDSTRAEPQTGGRIRGLASPVYTRGYFTSSIPIDRYNTSSITISRGPNSLLFGLGSAGGVVDASLGLAGIGNNKSKFQHRFDSNGSHRFEFDANRTLIEDRLAIKVSGMYEDKQFRQEEASQETKRFYGAFNAVLRKGDPEGLFGKTSLRGNVELGNESLTPPDALPPLQGWDSFFVPPTDYRQYSGIDYRQGFDSLNDGWEKWGTLDTRRTIAEDGTITPGYNELTTPLHSTSHIFGQLGLVYTNAGEGPSVIEGTETVGFQGWINGTGGLPFTNPFVNTRSYPDSDGAVGFKANTLTDTNIFDFKNHLITGDLQEITKRYDSEIVTLEQLMFGGKGGFEVTVGREFYHINKYQPFGGNGRNLPIYVDTSEWLTDTIPNPNVGRAFLLAQGDTDEWSSVKRENMRATAFYTLDFEEMTDGWAKMIGQHTVTALFQEEDSTENLVRYGKYWDGVGGTDFKRDVWGRDGNSNDTSFAGQTVQFAYISDDLRGVNYEDVRLRPLDFIPLDDGDTFNMNYYDAQDEIYKTGDFQVKRLARASGTNVSGKVVASEAFAWQSYWLDRHIVGLAGWRTDDIDTYGAETYQPKLGNNTLDVEKALIRAAEPNSPTQTGDTFTWSLVGHLPNNLVEKLPGINAVSVHYGESENFSAIKQRNDINNNPIGNPAGITEEVGLTVSFAEEKWNLRLTKYETSQALADVDNDKAFIAINEVTRALNSYKEAELNEQDFTSLQAYTQGIASYDDLYTRVLGLLPPLQSSLYQYTYDVDDQEWKRPEGVEGIEGISSTTDRIAEGYEMEIVGNPTKNWRISINVAKTQTTNDNSAEATFEYAQNHLAALDAAGLTDVNDSTGGIVTMGSRYRNQVFADLVSQRAKDGQVSQELREWRVNFVNNYKITEGRFKGASIGGALRYQSSVATGYETTIDEFGNQVPLLDKAFEGPSTLNGDMWIAYNKKLNNGVNWKIQLNVRNLVGDQDLVPIYTNPDGNTALYRIPPERSWFVTNTFNF